MADENTTTDPQQLQVSWTRNGSRSTGALVIHVCGESLVVDDGNIVKQSFQERAVKTLFDEAESRGIDLSQFTTPKGEPLTKQSMKAFLREYAAERTADRFQSSAPPAPKRLRGGDVVRGGHFITEHVAGLTNPHLVLGDGDRPMVKWELVLSWANGVRQVVDFTSILDLPGDEKLYLHPEPLGGDPLTITSQWSEDHLGRWLDGQTPDVADVYRRLTDTIHRRVWFDDTRRNGAGTTVALFIMASYLAPLFPAMPYLHANGPSGSGKTELLSLIGDLAFRPIKSSNTTGAVLFRSLHASGGTFLVDEAERQKLSRRGERSNDLMDILLSGYKRGSPAMRCEGEAHEVTSYDVYGPKALASISQPPDPLPSRCIRIQMLRKPKSVKVSRSRPGELRALRDDLHGLILGYVFDIMDCAASATLPSGIANRDAELWRPLMVLAKWLEDCGVADVVERAESFAEGCIGETADQGVEETHEAILAALLERVEQGMGDCIPKELLADLVRDDPKTFDKWTPAGVAAVLRTYDIRTKFTGGRRTYRYVTANQLRAVMETYGIESSDTAHVTTQPIQAPQNGSDDAKKADSGVALWGDGCGAVTEPTHDGNAAGATKNAAGATKNADSVSVVSVVALQSANAGESFSSADSGDREVVEI